MFDANIFKNIAFTVTPDVPPEISFDYWKNAVEKDGMVIEKISAPEPILCEIAIKQNPLSLQYIDTQYLTPEMCISATRHEWKVLEYIPECYIDSNICEIAVNRDGMALQWVPPSLQSNHICFTALIKSGDNVGKYWKHQSEELCKLIVMHNPLLLKHIFRENLSETQYQSVCEIAVTKNGMALEFIQLQTTHLCELAILQTPDAIQFVHIHSDILNIKSIYRDGCALKYIHPSHQTYELRMHSLICSKGESIQYMNEINEMDEKKEQIVNLRKMSLLCSSDNAKYLENITEEEMEIIAMSNWENNGEKYFDKYPEVKNLVNLQMEIKRNSTERCIRDTNKNINVDKQCASKNNLLNEMERDITGFIYVFSAGIGLWGVWEVGKICVSILWR